jgi:hypothetical protein
MGYGNLDMLERIQLKFYKYIFNLKKSTPSYMVYGDAGIMPLSVDIKSRALSYWTKVVTEQTENPQLRLSTKVYKILHKLHSENNIKSLWIDNIKTTLCDIGFPGIWYSQEFPNQKWLITSAKQKLKDIFIQQWQADISRTTNTNIYKLFKHNFKRSKYIDILPQYNCKKLMAFLTRNHRLPIEVGRWRSLQINERKCTLCNELGDEFHYLLVCPQFHIERRKYLREYYYRRPNMIKFIDLLSTENHCALRKLSYFADKILRMVNAV